MTNPALDDAAKLAGRILLAVIFIISGYAKIGGYAGTAQYMASKGLPELLLPLVIAVELGGGLLLIVGWQTRLAALALAGFTLIAGILFHYVPGNQGEMISFMKNLAITGGFLMVFAAGAGAWSVDGRKTA